MRHLFRLIHFKNRFFFLNTIIPWLALISPPSGSRPLPPPGGCLVTLVAGLANTCSPTLLTMRCVTNVSCCHRTVKVSRSCQLNYHIRDFLGSVLLLLYPTQRHALFSIVVTSLSPRRQHVKKITSHSCRQSCLYSDKSSRCFELVEKNFPRISPVSACLANEVLLLFVPDHLLKDVCIMNSLERQR